MNTAEAFRLIHNLDVRESLRKYQPRHAIVAVAADGTIRGIERFKDYPSWSEQDAAFEKYKGCAKFFADATTYQSIEDLEAKVQSCVDALARREIDPDGRRKRGLVGDTYFGGRPQKNG